MVLGIVDFVASTLWRGRANRKQQKKEAALRAKGVMAPATVVSAITRKKRSNVDGKFIHIAYTVDVQPEGAAPFRATFQHWSSRRGFTAIRGEIVGEAGKRIWVTYDPTNTADMIFEYDDSERESRLREADLDARRTVFNAEAEQLQLLKTSGSPAEATIVQVDDLDLPYPRRESTAFNLHLDVTPAGGQTYRAVAPALINVAALAKYSAGRRVFVMFDPNDPQRVVLDSERNRALPN